MTTTDPVDHLIREIAVKHGVALGRDDPILILQTLNAQLLEEGARDGLHKAARNVLAP